MDTQPRTRDLALFGDNNHNVGQNPNRYSNGLDVYRGGPSGNNDRQVAPMAFSSSIEEMAQRHHSMNKEFDKMANRMMENFGMGKMMKMSKCHSDHNANSRNPFLGDPFANDPFFNDAGFGSIDKMMSKMQLIITK